MSKRFMGVGQPTATDAGCWVIVRQYVGSLFPQSTHCGCEPRPGKLTCRHHDKYEGLARKKQSKESSQ